MPLRATLSGYTLSGTRKDNSEEEAGMQRASGRARRRAGLPRAVGQGALLLLLMAGTSIAATAAQIELVSKTDPVSPSAGSTPSGPSSLGDISADGRYVVFVSPADHVVPGQIDAPYRPGDFVTPGSWDVFLRDRVTQKTTLVSHSSSSPVTAGQIGVSSEDCFAPAISADGKYVVFVSGRRNLVPGQTGEGRNVFLYDRILNTTKLVSHLSGSPAAGAGFFSVSSRPVLSADGRFVAYTSDGAGLVPGHGSEDKILLYDRMTGSNTFVDQVSRDLKISADGRFIVYSLDDNQIHLYDRITGSRTLVSHADGSPLNPGNDQSTLPEINADGSVVVFLSWATDLAPGQIDTYRTSDLFLYERASGATTLVSRKAATNATAGDGESYTSALSADGRRIAFYSLATDLVPAEIDTNGAGDIYLFDRTAGSTTLVSHKSGAATATANRGSLSFALSADGRRIAFSTQATDLVQNQPDSTPWSNLFVQDPTGGTTTLVGKMSRPGLPSFNLLFLGPLISADGRAVALGSASNLVAGDLNTDWDVYLYGDAPDPGPFVPCTLLDTRRPADRPALRSNIRRVLSVAGACGVPAKARTVSVDVTVLQGTGKGNLQFYPGNVSTSSSGILRFQKGANRTAGFTLPLATNGAGTLAILPFVAGNGTVQVIVQVKGYTQ